MLNVLIGNYIKNIWYNLITIVIIIATIIISTTYISNMLSQTKLYRLISPYLNENSLITDVWGFDDSVLTRVEDSIKTEEISCYSKQAPNLKTFAVYDEEVMSVLKPRLSRGRYIQSGTKDVIEVLASDSGFEVGDVVTVYIDEKGAEEHIPVDFKVVGIISDGQKLFVSSGKASNDMGYEDMFVTYSYEQLKESVFITTREQLDKIDVTLRYLNFCSIYKMEDDITEEELYENQMKITDYETTIISVPSAAIRPSSEKLTEGMEADMKNVLLKYIPLTIGVVILVVVCIVGIVSIKSAKSMRYYAIMHMCGMNQGTTIGLSGMEMLINCIFAMVIAISLIVIQNYYSIIGTINCELGSIQILVMMGISLIITATTMLVTGATMKESTTMEILRDTAY